MSRNGRIGKIVRRRNDIEARRSRGHSRRVAGRSKQKEQEFERRRQCKRGIGETRAETRLCAELVARRCRTNCSAIWSMLWRGARPVHVFASFRQNTPAVEISTYKTLKEVHNGGNGESAIERSRRAIDVQENQWLKKESSNGKKPSKWKSWLTRLGITEEWSGVEWWGIRDPTFCTYWPGGLNFKRPDKPIQRERECFR